MPGLTSSARRRSNRGVSVLVFAMMAPLIIGAVGLSVDGGRLAVERANLQSAADSAARAVGQDCARASRMAASASVRALCTDSGAAPTIELAMNGNSTGAAGTTSGTLSAASGSTTVTISKTVPMTLGATIGIQPKALTASATVTWNQTPTAGTTIPLTLDTCDFNAWRLNPSSVRRLYRYDADPRTSQQTAYTCSAPGGGTNTSIGGALWVGNMDSPGYDESTCLASTVLGPNDGKIFPQKYEFPQTCTNRMNALVPGKTYLVAIGEHDGWSGWGTTVWPRVSGYAPFVITGWRMGDQNSVFSSNLDPSAPTCTGKCRGIQGYFTASVVQLEGVDSYGTNSSADLGSVRVKITS